MLHSILLGLNKIHEKYEVYSKDESYIFINSLKTIFSQDLNFRCVYFFELGFISSLLKSVN